LFGNNNESAITVETTDITFSRVYQIKNTSNPLLLEADENEKAFRVKSNNDPDYFDVEIDASGNLKFVSDVGDTVLTLLDYDSGSFNIQANKNIQLKDSFEPILKFTRPHTGRVAHIVWDVGGNWYLGQPDSDDYLGDGTDFYIGQSDSTPDVTIDSNGNVRIGNYREPESRLDIEGAITQTPLSADPSDPSDGNSVQWVSDGTGSGDAGDVMMKINVGGTTKTVTLVDYSTLS